ncbi:Phosducin-like protein 2 [Kluyveromyces marxianus]|nr:Phosducin-like protein 2 [Kluyveromyces marxianus]KAG0685495.1 Phosducin-like protein 2 [Kluyveromyces marxianus]
MQNEPMFQVQVDETEDTEWNDILRAHGVIPERPPSPTAQLEEALEEALAKQHNNRLEGKDLSDLEDLEDDEDEDFLEFYKQKRLNEIRQLQQKAKFGSVYHISKPEYNKEITECSKGEKKSQYVDDNKDLEKEGVYVFVHLTCQAKIESKLLSSIFEKAAVKFPQMKFVEIPGNRAIENYPDSNCPTLIVYYRGDVVKHLVTLLELGGKDTTLNDFEKLMVDIGAVDEKDDRLIMNYEDDFTKEEKHLRYGKSGIRSGIVGKFNVGVGRNDDNDDDDFFD